MATCRQALRLYTAERTRCSTPQPRITSEAPLATWPGPGRESSARPGWRMRWPRAGRRLRLYTAKRTPLDYTMTRNNLNMVLREIGAEKRGQL